MPDPMVQELLGRGWKPIPTPEGQYPRFQNPEGTITKTVPPDPAEFFRGLQTKEAETEAKAAEALSKADPAEQFKAIGEALKEQEAQPDYRRALTVERLGLPSEDTWKTQGKIGVGEALGGREWGKDIPVLGAGVVLGEVMTSYNDMALLRRDQAQPFLDPELKEMMIRRMEDATVKAQYLEARGETLPAWVVSRLADMVPFAAEIAATGGVTAAARVVATVAGRKLATKVAVGAMSRAVGTALGKVAGYAASGVITEATVGLPRVAAGTVQRMTPEGFVDADGKLVVSKEGQDFLPSLAKATVENAIEYGTEFAGAGIVGAAGKISGKAVGLIPGGARALARSRELATGALRRIWKDGEASKAIKGILLRSGYHGPVEEWSEERAGTILHALAGDTSPEGQDLKARMTEALTLDAKTLKQWGMEAILFSVPAGPGAIMGTAQALRGTPAGERISAIEEPSRTDFRGVPGKYTAEERAQVSAELVRGDAMDSLREIMGASAERVRQAIDKAKEARIEGETRVEKAKRKILGEYDDLVGESLDVEAELNAAWKAGDTQKAWELNDRLEAIQAKGKERFSGLNLGELAKPLDAELLGKRPGAEQPKPADARPAEEVAPAEAAKPVEPRPRAAVKQEAQELGIPSIGAKNRKVLEREIAEKKKAIDKQEEVRDNGNGGAREMKAAEVVEKPIAEQDAAAAQKAYDASLARSAGGGWRSAEAAADYAKVAGLSADRVVADLRAAGYSDADVVGFMKKPYGQLDVEVAISRLGAKKPAAEAPKAEKQPAESEPARVRREVRDALKIHPDKRTPEQTKLVSQHNPVTGLPNMDAWNHRAKPDGETVTFIDVDGLKPVNDRISHEAGNHLLAGLADAAQAEGLRIFHPHGDEFFVSMPKGSNAQRAMEALDRRLQAKPLKYVAPDGTVSPLKVSFSHGTGRTLHEAESAARIQKADKLARGLRVERKDQSGVPGPTEGASGEAPGRNAGLGGRPIAPEPPAGKPPDLGRANTAPEVNDSLGRMFEAKKEYLQLARERMGLDRVPTPEQKARLKNYQEAWDQKIPERAMEIADSVIKKPRPLDAVTSAGLHTKQIQLEIAHEQATARWEAADKAGDRAAAEAARGEAAAMKQEFDVLTVARAKSGSETGRALEILKTTMNEKYDILNQLSLAKMEKGEPLTAKETAAFEKAVAELESVKKERDALQKQVSEANADSYIKGEGIRRYRKMSTAQKDAELADLTTKFKDMLAAPCVL